MAEAVLRGGALDPAAPQSIDEVLGERDKARDLANFGTEGLRQFESQFPLTPPTIDVDWAKVTAFRHACQNSQPRVGYKLGAKIPSDTSAPGTGFTHVDCSGFVRAAIRRSTDPKATDFPDGSVVQHDWIKAKKFDKSTVADGCLSDGTVRIAFLSPNDAPSGIGHVVLIRNGATAESHSGVGPNSRPFNGKGWQALAQVYVLKN